jgi:pyruvate dehydrogenase E1 component alpha subunit
MGPNDVGTPLQRDMGVHITRGIEPWRIFAQYMGRDDGPTRGRDGNVHMGDARLGLHTMVSHLPRCFPSASGWPWPSRSATSARRRRLVRRGRCGPGRRPRGHEPRRRPSPPGRLRIDNNQWAYSTPSHLEYAVDHLADRAAAYGFDGVVVDGTDVLAVYRRRSTRSRRPAMAAARR